MSEFLGTYIVVEHPIGAEHNVRIYSLKGGLAARPCE